MNDGNFGGDGARIEAKSSKVSGLESGSEVAKEFLNFGVMALL